MSDFGKAGAEEFWLVPPDRGAVIRSRLIFINSGDLSCSSVNGMAGAEVGAKD